MESQALDPWLAIAAQHDPEVRALMDVTIRRETSFCFGALEIFPAVFARRPWKEGVASGTEVCLAKNGGGDLYLWNALTGAVRLVIHDEDWRSGRVGDSIDAWLQQELHRALEAIELEDVEEYVTLDEPHLSRVRFAIGVSSESLQDEVREALVTAGLLTA